MDFLSSAITPSEHQATPSHIVQGAESAGLLPVLSNMNELTVGNSVTVSLAAGTNNINGNLNNQMTAFSNGIISPDTNQMAASNPSVSQIPGITTEFYICDISAIQFEDYYISHFSAL